MKRKFHPFPKWKRIHEIAFSFRHFTKHQPLNTAFKNPKKKRRKLRDRIKQHLEDTKYFSLSYGQIKYQKDSLLKFGDLSTGSMAGTQKIHISITIYLIILYFLENWKKMCTKTKTKGRQREWERERTKKDWHLFIRKREREKIRKLVVFCSKLFA